MQLKGLLTIRTLNPQENFTVKTTFPSLRLAVLAVMRAELSAKDARRLDALYLHLVLTLRT
jgi:hypothetical protein